MRYKITSKIISLFLAILFVLPLCLFSVSAADAVPTFEDINETDVVSDLNRIGIDITKYQKDIEADYCRILYFLEYGYDYHNVSDDYGLYIYVWNPSGKGINCVSGQNSIELQISPTSNVDRDGLGFSKHKLELCNYSTTQGYECVFYKFKVHVSSSFRSFLNRDLRTYDISGIELQHAGDSKPTDYAVGGVYSFDGYMPYHGKTSSVNNTLNVSVIDRLILEIELNPTSWKTQTSDKGAGYQYEMFSVYFSIPNSIIRDYGNPANKEHKGLVQIDGQYSKHKINGIVNNDNLSDVIKPYLGKYISFDASVPFSFYTDKREYVYSTLTPAIITQYRDPFNINFSSSSNEVWNYSLDPVRKGLLIKKLCSVLNFSNDEFDIIGHDELLSQLNICWGANEVFCLCDVCKSSVGPFQDVGFGKDVSYSVKAGEDLAESLVDYYSSHSWWDAFLTGDFGLYNTPENYKDAMSIQAISLSDILVSGTEDVLKESDVISNKYFVNESDVDSFGKFALSEFAKLRTTYLMRLSVEDYYCREATVNLNGSTYNDGEYYFEKTIFQNIDVFSFTFENEYSQRCKIPVVASPIDNVGTITPTDPGASDNDKGGNFPKWPDLSIIAKLLALIAFLLIIALVVWFISKIFGLPATWLFTSFAKVLVWILSFPFKLFSWIFNSIKTLGGAPLKSSDKKKKDQNKKE